MNPAALLDDRADLAHSVYLERRDAKESGFDRWARTRLSGWGTLLSSSRRKPGPIFVVRRAGLEKRMGSGFRRATGIG
jgi:hypothetical protein